jgi:hypothetical protein
MHTSIVVTRDEGVIDNLGVMGTLAEIHANVEDFVGCDQMWLRHGWELKNEKCGRQIRSRYGRCAGLCTPATWKSERIQRNRAKTQNADTLKSTQRDKHRLSYSIKKSGRKVIYTFLTMHMTSSALHYANDSHGLTVDNAKGTFVLTI